MPAKFEKACHIIHTLKQAGHEAFLVGGCVRDRVLGIESPDYDIATSALPDQVQSLFRRNVAVGAHFGVIIVMDGDDAFEVATFRADDRYLDGRRPVSVRFVSAQEDVERRDFTINGLLFDIDSGKILDYVGGLQDLADRRIRTIGNAADRFTEDKLRLMRAVRFAARFGFSIDPATLHAIHALATEITCVSWERIRDEILKMLMNRNPHSALRLLDSTGLLAVVLPEVHRLKGVRQPEEFHPEGDVFEHTLRLLELMDQPTGFLRNETLALSALLHDIGKPQTFYEATDRIRFHNHPAVGSRIAASVLKRLRCSNQLIDDVCHCVDNHMNFINVTKMRPNRLKRFLRSPVIEEELELHRLDCLASHGGIENYVFLKQQQKELGRERISPPPLISGKRLIEMGFSPGPQFKQILAAVEDLQLEEKIATPQEAEKFISENF